MELKIRYNFSLKGENIMSKSSKRQYTNSEKVKIALEAMSSCFSKKPTLQPNEDQRLIEDLYKQIGKLNVENEWLKKSELFKC